MPFADLLPLFAQVNNNFRPGGPGGGPVGPGGGPGGPGAPPAGPGAAEAGMMAVFVIAYIAFIVVMLGVSILFLLTMYRALNTCAPRNRTMEPGQVWFTFIPIAGVVFYIMAILKTPESLANEYHDRGLRGDGDFGKNLGLWFVITSFVCPGVNVIFWIMYWAKIAEHTKELKSGAGRYDGYDDEDDRPRRRSRSRRDDDDTDEDDEDYRPRRRD
jgi:hypothetical protein